MSLPKPILSPEAKEPDVTAEDLLTWDQPRLIRFLMKFHHSDGLIIEGIEGVTSLSLAKKEALRERIMTAADQLSFPVEDLQTRLQELASVQNESAQNASAENEDDSFDTPIASPFDHLIIESSCREELARDGCRPVCSMDELKSILNAPITSSNMEAYEAVQGFLEDSPDSRDGHGELQSLFTRQFMSWWTFRRLQWHERGLEDSSAGLAAYIEASHRMQAGAGYKKMASSYSLQSTWNESYIPQRPFREGRTFTAHSRAVKTRLAPYHFAKPLQLRKNPIKQDAWTTWLEYLSYELLESEKWASYADRQELEYQRSRKRLLEANSSNSNHVASDNLLSDSLQPSHPSTTATKAKAVKNLAVAEAQRDQIQDAIDKYLKATNKYAERRRLAMNKRYLVDWIIKEAHLMEQEISEQEKLAKDKKKRHRDEILPRAKRVKHNTGDNGMVIRRSDRLRKQREDK